MSRDVTSNTTYALITTAPHIRGRTEKGSRSLAMLFCDRGTGSLAVVVVNVVVVAVAVLSHYRITSCAPKPFASLLPATSF